MSFLAGDLADLGKYTEITSTNVVEFVEKFVETLTYKLTSSSGQGKRKETSVKNALAADQLLRFFVDSRYKNKDVDHARIKAIVSSVDVNIRNAPEFLGISGCITLPPPTFFSQSTKRTHRGALRESFVKKKRIRALEKEISTLTKFHARRRWRRDGMPSDS